MTIVKLFTEPQLPETMTAKMFKNDGYIALFTMLSVSAIGLAIALSMLLLGVSTSRSSFSVEQSNMAMAHANACVEDALQEIRDLTSYTGSDSITFSDGSCNYTVTGSAPTKNIEASGTVGTVTRRVEVDTSAVSPKILISSWAEKADF